MAIVLAKRTDGGKQLRFDFLCELSSRFQRLYGILEECDERSNTFPFLQLSHANKLLREQGLAGSLHGLNPSSEVDYRLSGNIARQRTNVQRGFGTASCDTKPDRCLNECAWTHPTIENIPRVTNNGRIIGESACLRARRLATNA